MKKIIMALVFLAVLASSAFGAWVEIPLPDDDLQSLLAASDGSLWYGGQEDLYRTTDQGANWTIVNDSTWQYFSSLIEKPSGTVVVTHNKEFIQPPFDFNVYADETADNGSTWISIPSFTGMDFGPNSGVAITNDFILYGGYGDYQGGAVPSIRRSFDAGQTWEIININQIESYFTSMSVSQGGSIFVSDQYLGVYRSQDSGTTWTLVDESTILDAMALQVFAASNGNVYSIFLDAITYDQSVRVSSDGGNTWSDSAMPVGCINVANNYSANSIAEDSNGTIWLGCNNPATVFTTNDGGTTWESIGELTDLNEPNIVTAENGSVYAWDQTGWFPNEYRLFRMTCLDGCYVDGVCYNNDDLNPNNSCQICDSALNPSGWTDNDGAGCDDGIDCTEDDSCLSGECGGTPNDSLCDDGTYCNGAETCDADNDCVAGTPIYCPDDGLFCNGNEFCDENADACSSTGDPCGALECDELADDCIQLDDDDDDTADDDDDNDTADDDDDTADDDDDNDTADDDENNKVLSDSEDLAAGSNGCGC